jgi:hypothetical protein
MNEILYRGQCDCPYCHKTFEATFKEYSQDTVLICSHCNKSFTPRESLSIALGEGLPKVEKMIKDIESGTIKATESHLDHLKRLRDLLKSVEGQGRQ